ncbi:MAG: PepSY domain-containing protein [Pseudomonadales bacterium]|jgi:uncharacterized iron-regulated membrane protein|nr:PepSY domain-containing protein [Pseudomonadales bacterium]
MKFPLFSTVRTLHAWGGITLSLLMMLVSFTGTLLVWKDDYLRLTLPAARVAFSPTPEALATIGAAIDQRFDPAQVLKVYFATAELPLTQVILSGERYAYLDTEGGLVDEWRGNGRAEEWLFDLHHRLLLDNLGLTLVGAAACAMVVLVIAGAVAFWPARRGWRHGLLPTSSARPALLATHRNLGIMLALPLLLTLITGITLAFPAPLEEWLLGELRSSEDYSNAMMDGVDNIEGDTSGAWLPAMQRALAVFPSGAVVRSAQVPGPYSNYRILGLQQRGEWSRNGLSLVYIDADGGWMDLRHDALHLPLRERVYNTALPLHTGRLGQRWYQVALTLSGVGILLLSALGLVSFIKRYTKA